MVYMSRSMKSEYKMSGMNLLIPCRKKQTEVEKKRKL